MSEATGHLTIIRPGMMSLILDRGRAGLAFYAIPPSGPLDRSAAELANEVLQNDPDAPVIECHFLPPTLRFDSDAVVCLTGAHMGWTLDQQPVSRFQTIPVMSGQLLTGAAAKDGCRAYIGVQGCLQSDRSFGSVSTYVPGRFGANNGRPLTVGDVVRWTRPQDVRPEVSLRLADVSPGDQVISLLPGPEYDWLSTAAQTALTTEAFQVSPDSNRMGARLEGPTLKLDRSSLTHSVPVLPGMIQLPPSGQPIVVLQDGQTTGGYPRIGYLAESHVAKLSQIAPAKLFRFRLVGGR